MEGQAVDLVCLVLELVVCGMVLSREVIAVSGCGNDHDQSTAHLRDDFGEYGVRAILPLSSADRRRSSIRHASRSHIEITVAVVLGVPDQLWGENVVAAVVPATRTRTHRLQPYPHRQLQETQTDHLPRRPAQKRLRQSTAARGTQTRAADGPAPGGLRPAGGKRAVAGSGRMSAHSAESTSGQARIPDSPTGR